MVLAAWFVVQWPRKPVHPRDISIAAKDPLCLCPVDILHGPQESVSSILALGRTRTCLVVAWIGIIHDDPFLLMQITKKRLLDGPV